MAFGLDWFVVSISIVGRQPLIGMSMLADYEVRILVVPGGDVEIKLWQES